MRALWRFAAVGFLTVAAAACSGADGVTVERAWARTSPMMASAGAVYMDLESAVADRLTGASVDPSVAPVVEIHETAMADSGDMSGQMTMREVGEIALPAGETVSLEPGGYHIMLLALPAPLTVGQTFDITLSFESAGDLVVEVEVRDEAP